MEQVPGGPPGLLMQKNFITPDHHARLLTLLPTLPWPVRENLTSRLSLHYGYTFSYKTFKIDQENPFIPFPEWLPPLFPKTEPRPPDQVCLQYYPPGSGIPPHVDTHSAFDQLYALSLGDTITMQFKSAGDQGTGEIREVLLESGSLVQMSGESRLTWTHGIRGRKTDVVGGKVRSRRDRWSLTYRWVRKGGECRCGDAKLCDTRMRELGVEKEFRWKGKGDGGKAGGEKNGVQDCGEKKEEVEAEVKT